MNLRSIAYHHPTMFESHAIPTALSAVRTHSFWKRRRGPHTTDIFLDLEMDKTAQKAALDPQDGEMQQAQTLDLEVVESQNHHNEHSLGSKHDVD
jgi:hypothetical protein